MKRIVFFWLALLSTLKAESVLDGMALEQYLASANAVIVFTSQDGLSSGIYNFTKTGTQMRMYNLPLQYHFDPLTDNSNLFMTFDMGYSDSRNDRNVDVNGTFLNIDNQMQSYVGGIGLGIRYKLTTHSAILFGGEIIYSRIGVSARTGDGLSEDDISGFFDKSARDNFSYKLFAEYVYTRTMNEHKISLKTNYKLYHTLNEFKVADVVEGVVNDVLSLSSQTSVFSLLCAYETKPLFHHEEMNFTMEPYLKGNYVWGDLADVAQINFYGTAGLSFYWNTPEKSAYIYRYFIEPSISKGDGLEGLNLSVGFSLDF